MPNRTGFAVQNLRTWGMLPGGGGCQDRARFAGGTSTAECDLGRLLLRPTLEKKPEVDPPHWLVYVNHGSATSSALRCWEDD